MTKKKNLLNQSIGNAMKMNEFYIFKCNLTVTDSIWQTSFHYSQITQIHGFLVQEALVSAGIMDSCHISRREKNLTDFHLF